MKQRRVDRRRVLKRKTAALKTSPATTDTSAMFATVITETRETESDESSENARNDADAPVVAAASGAAVKIRRSKPKGCVWIEKNVEITHRPWGKVLFAHVTQAQNHSVVRWTFLCCYRDIQQQPESFPPPSFKSLL